MLSAAEAVAGSGSNVMDVSNSEEVPVPRYFFHLKNDTAVVLDEEGLFLPNVDAVRIEIAQSVQEILCEPEYEHHGFWGQELEIADEHGKTVMVVRF